MVRLWHAVGGLYVWEFFTTLEYEWKVFRGRLPYRQTIWIYSLARVGGLLSVSLRFVLMDNRTPINCQVVFSFMIALAYLSMSASSLLIVLRIIAIWNRNRVVITVSIIVWVTNAAFLIQGAARLRAAWEPVRSACVSLQTEDSILSLLNLLVTDLALLLIMLVGLLRLRHGHALGLTQLLWKQGVLWLLLATMAEVPPVVFIALNLNGPFNLMFQPPTWITMSIAATRMHRSLVDFASGSTDIFSAQGSLQHSNLPPRPRRIPATLTSLDRMEVAVHVVSEQHVSRQVSSDGSCIDTYEPGKREAESVRPG